MQDISGRWQSIAYCCYRFSYICMYLLTQVHTYLCSTYICTKQCFQFPAHFNQTMDEFIYVKTLVSRTLDDGVHIGRYLIPICSTIYLHRQGADRRLHDSRSRLATRCKVAKRLIPLCFNYLPHIVLEQHLLSRLLLFRLLIHTSFQLHQKLQ